MRATRAVLAVAISGLWLGGCGDNGPSAECVGPDDPCGEVEETVSILGAGAASYSEEHEPENATDNGAEASGYVLESDRGLAISGSFETASPTADSFIFNSGTFGGAGEPDFPGADIQVIIDGRALDTGEGLSLSLDTVQELGYSSLSGSYFMNAAVMKGKDYVLKITPAASLAGKHYTVEIRGHVAD